MPDMNTLNANIYSPDSSQGRFVLTNYIDLYKLRARNNMPMDTFSSSTVVQNNTSTSTTSTNSEVGSTGYTTGGYNGYNGYNTYATNNDSFVAQQSANSLETVPQQGDTYYPQETKYIIKKEKSSNPFPWLLSAGLAILSGVLLFKNHKLNNKFTEAVAEETGKIEKNLQEKFKKQLEEVAAENAKQIEELRAAAGQGSSEDVLKLQEELAKTRAGINSANAHLDTAKEEINAAQSDLAGLKGVAKKSTKKSKKTATQQSEEVTNTTVAPETTPKKTKRTTTTNIQNTTSTKFSKNISGYRIATPAKNAEWNVVSNKTVEFLEPDEFNINKLYNRIYWDLSALEIYPTPYQVRVHRDRIMPFITKNEKALKFDTNGKKFPNTTDNKYIYGYYDKHTDKFNVLGSIKCSGEDAFSKIPNWKPKKEILAVKIPDFNNPNIEYYDGNTIWGTVKYIFPGIFGGNIARGKVIIPRVETH